MYNRLILLDFLEEGNLKRQYEIEEIGMYTGLTKEICSKAWMICFQTVLAASDLEVTNKKAGALVVLDPQTGKILFETLFNTDHPNISVYRDIALAKAQVSWETKLPSRVVQQEAPHLYKKGMAKWGGSVIENGLVVAFSGVQAVFDEAIATTVASWIIAICRDEMTKPGGVMDSDSSFIGTSPSSNRIVVNV